MNNSTHRLGIIFQIFIALLMYSCTTKINEEPDRSYSNTEQELIDIRRDIHRHPELSGKEIRTSGLVENFLRKQGIEVQTGIGGYGVVGILKGDLPGPVIAFRADMDAMPSDSPDPVSFKSENPGVRHICGHDVHTTIALGVARGLSADRGSLPGTVKFIFQPAEEDATGARAMIKDGVLENPSPEVIFGLHVTNLQTGQILCFEGPALPSVNLLNITLSGRNNPESDEPAVNHYIRKINNIGKRKKIKNGYVRVNVAQFEYDPDNNQWILECAVFISDDAIYSEAKTEIEKLLRDKLFHNTEVKNFNLIKGVPALVNDAELMRSTYPVLKSMLGKENVIIREQILNTSSGEDFSFYQQFIPGAFFFLGASDKAKGFDATIHTAHFAVDEEAIFTGVELMKRIMLDYLQNH